jgi:hypothetical protein
MVSMEMTIKLGETGFNSDMIANSLKVLREEIQVLISSYSSNEKPSVLEDYQDNSAWLQFVKA